ncbi:hypothetical protein OIE66_26455 [Nonomuraea sp. NBC_01738]|uniref:hypothetical protein n=1 Tax=Nonomuraea sp. NBC_01738 TaxID=2976003 RepID=UPI002E11F9F1|nr:hypothetical protein OIE66_26455 [Nonomuraea sp. NBC_01738]
MSIQWVNLAIDDLRAWGRARGVEVDADEVRLLCDYASDYLGVDELGDFTPGTFDELLLSIYPRKVIAPPESAQETVAAARTLVDHLESTGLAGAPVAAEMRARLDEIALEMPGALADENNFGMAKSLFSSIGPESLEQSITIPSGEVPDLGEAPCECPGCSPLPAVRLAGPETLDRGIAAVPLLADRDRLLTWLGDRGSTPTAKGALRAKDAASAEVPEPRLLWALPRGEGRDGWAEVVAHLVEQDTGGAVTGSAELDDELYDLFDMLYRLQVRVPVAVIADYLGEISDSGEVDVAGVLERLSWAGLVEVKGDTAELPPHAVWALRELYLAHGLSAPEAPDLAGADAMGLIEGLLEGVPTEIAESDIQRWLSGRQAGAAASELLAAASGAPAVARGIAVTIVDRLGIQAEPAVRARLDEPELRPHAIHWLTARGLAAPPLTQDELLWVSVDMLALAIPAAEADPEIFAENMAASGPPAHLIEEMWRVDHPDVVDVLELLGRSLPDGGLAKAARKAAFKARSRAIG